MARVNVGVNPQYLADQHLVAESVEITMITGSLRKHNFQIKSPIPDKFKLGTGHINFFKNKLVYLKRRLKVVNDEMLNRGMNPGTKLDLDEFPKTLHGDWTPTLEASVIIRNRIAERLVKRTNGKPGAGFYRYKRVTITDDMSTFVRDLLNSELYYL